MLLAEIFVLADLQSFNLLNPLVLRCRRLPFSRQVVSIPETSEIVVTLLPLELADGSQEKETKITRRRKEAVDGKE